jgi:hypothetical protein
MFSLWSLMAAFCVALQTILSLMKIAILRNERAGLEARLAEALKENGGLAAIIAGKDEVIASRDAELATPKKVLRHSSNSAPLLRLGMTHQLSAPARGETSF